MNQPEYLSDEISRWLLDLPLLVLVICFYLLLMTFHLLRRPKWAIRNLHSDLTNLRNYIRRHLWRLGVTSRD